MFQNLKTCNVGQHIYMQRFQFTGRPVGQKLNQPNGYGRVVYRASRVIDDLVNTESTKGASSPGCIVVGTIV